MIARSFLGGIERAAASQVLPAFSWFNRCPRMEGLTPRRKRLTEMPIHGHVVASMSALNDAPRLSDTTISFFMREARTFSVGVRTVP
jgi:hypothetical protein